MNQTDAIIIGAGPAGCTAAILLARAGWNVRLIEQHRFPRDKVCGECLSALGIEVARRLDVAVALRQLGAVRLSRSTLIAPDGARATIELPSEMWGLSRRAMDACLLDAARTSGATIMQPARCESITPGIAPAVNVRDLLTNAQHTFTCSRLLICDGKAPAHATRNLGIKAHYECVQAAPDAIALFGVRGHYVGVAPVEHHCWNVAMSVPVNRVARFRGDFDAMFLELRRENIALDYAFAGARRCGAWLASSLPRFAVAPEWMDGTIPLGNAAAALDPIGGEGIGLAMRSAELTAMELISADREQRAPDIEKLRTQFRRLWQVRSAACHAAAITVSSPTLAHIAAPIMQQTPALQRFALYLTGKLV